MKRWKAAALDAPAQGVVLEPADGILGFTLATRHVYKPIQVIVGRVVEQRARYVRNSHLVARKVVQGVVVLDPSVVHPVGPVEGARDWRSVPVP